MIDFQCNMEDGWTVVTYKKRRSRQSNTKPRHQAAISPKEINKDPEEDEHHHHQFPVPSHYKCKSYDTES